MFTKQERNIRGLDFILNPTAEGDWHQDSYWVSKSDKHVASVRLADGLLVVKYPPEASGDLYQEMPPFTRDQFRDEASRSECLDRCAVAIRERMMLDGSLIPERVDISSVYVHGKPSAVRAIEVGMLQDVMCISFADARYCVIGIDQSFVDDDDPILIEEKGFDIFMCNRDFKYEQLEALFGTVRANKCMETRKYEDEANKGFQELKDRDDFVRLMQRFDPSLYEIYKQRQSNQHAE